MTLDASTGVHTSVSSFAVALIGADALFIQLCKNIDNILSPTATSHRQITNAVCYGSFMVIMPGAQ